MSPAGPATHPGATLSLVPVNARPAVQSLCEPRGRRCLQVEGQRSSRQMRQTPTGPMSSPHLSQCVPRWGQTPMPDPRKRAAAPRDTLSPSPPPLSPPRPGPRVCEAPRWLPAQVLSAARVRPLALDERCMCVVLYLDQRIPSQTCRVMSLCYVQFLPAVQAVTWCL